MEVIVPTRHEAGNVAALTARTVEALRERHIAGGLLFVDDSDDSTPEVLGGLSAAEPDVEVLHRRAGERRGGLAGAVIAGFAASDAGVLAVMDGDLQHPPEVLGDLLAPVLAGRADMAVASRFVGAGDCGGLSGRGREVVSRTAGGAVRALLPRVRTVRDPLSGFFALRREVIDGVTLEAEGFKILLEVLARGRWDSVVEVPFSFAARPAGRSKASLAVGASLVRQVVRLQASQEALAAA